MKERCTLYLVNINTNNLVNSPYQSYIYVFFFIIILILKTDEQRKIFFDLVPQEPPVNQKRFFFELS